MLANTASFHKQSTFKDPAFITPVNGWSVALIVYISSTYINNLLHKQIVQLLEIKFVNHYKVLVKEEEGISDTHNPENLFLLT
jgi:hypothetical protein